MTLLILDVAMIPFWYAIAMILSLWSFNMSFWYELWYDSLDMIRWYDSGSYPFCYDDLLVFSFIWDSVLMICSDWLCYDYLIMDSFCSDLFYSDARVFSLAMEVPWPWHWGTNGMTLSVAVWLVHDVPILIWYDMRSLGHYTCIYLSCEQVYIYVLFCGGGGGVLMHPKFCFDMRRPWLGCACLTPPHFWEVAPPFWYLEVSPLRTLWFGSICDFDTYRVAQVGRLVAFLCFVVSIRVALVDTPLLIRALWFLLLSDYAITWSLYDTSFIWLMIHYVDSHDPSHFVWLLPFDSSCSYSVDLWYLFSLSLISYSFDRWHSFQQELMISFLILIYVSIIHFVIYLFISARAYDFERV